MWSVSGDVFPEYDMCYSIESKLVTDTRICFNFITVQPEPSPPINAKYDHCATMREPISYSLGISI